MVAIMVWSLVLCSILGVYPMQESATQIGTISFYKQIQNGLDNCEKLSPV